MRAYVRLVDRANRLIGRVVMYGIFVMAILLCWTSLVESSANMPIAVFLAAALKRRLTWKVFETSAMQTLGITCMFLCIILAALASGAVFDGPGAVK